MSEFKSLKDYVGTGIVSADGRELEIQDVSILALKTELSQTVYVPPGKVEAHTSNSLTYEIPAAVLMKEAYVEVVNDVEGTRYVNSLALYPGHFYVNGAWYSLSVDHQYVYDKRAFTVTLSNWSHNWGRNFRLYLQYEG